MADQIPTPWQQRQVEAARAAQVNGAPITFSYRGENRIVHTTTGMVTEVTDEVIAISTYEDSPISISVVSLVDLKRYMSSLKRRRRLGYILDILGWTR